MKPRRLNAACLLIAAATLVACGGGGTAGEADDPPREKAPPGERVDSARDIAVGHQTGNRTRPAPDVYYNDPGPTPPGNETSGAVDFSRMVAVTMTVYSGCAELQDAWLYADGDRLAMRKDLGDESDTCYAQYVFTVHFQVPREKMPARPLASDGTPLRNIATDPLPPVPG